MVLCPGTILIIELDPLGGIYNNAPPCRQCGQALVRVGVARAVFSCDGGGLHQRCFRANPDLDAPSLALALQCDAFVKVDVAELELFEAELGDLTGVLEECATFAREQDDTCN